MKLHILSDLHTEGTAFTAPDTDADVIILAGDIGKHTHGIEWAAKQKAFAGKPVIMVLGNHEYYGAELFGITNQCRIKAEEFQAQGISIFLLENDVLILEGVKFIGSVMWSDYRLFGEANMQICMVEAKRGMRDHQVIRYSERGAVDDFVLRDALFLPVHAERLFRKAKNFLREELAKPFDGKTVVVTHHLPSLMSVATRFSADILSAAFASNCDDLVERADLWIHGHTHDCFDYSLGKCRVVCNPRGYPREHSNGFRPGLVVEV